MNCEVRTVNYAISGLILLLMRTLVTNQNFLYLRNFVTFFLQYKDPRLKCNNRKHLSKWSTRNLSSVA